MTAPVLPWLSGAVISILVADESFMDECHSRVAGRTPSDVTIPYATVRALTNTAISARAGAWRGVIQVTGWAPGAVSDTPEDPALTAWRIAATACAVFGSLEKRQQTYAGIFLTPQVIQGPTEEVDTSRGTEAPMYGCSIQIELSVITS